MPETKEEARRRVKKWAFPRMPREFWDETDWEEIIWSREEAKKSDMSYKGRLIQGRDYPK